ncbi:MAG: thiamine phosphate synthase [Anaerotignum sp.]|nr:thiamine phosphate synthase [Anaerotignum sp.]
MSDILCVTNRILCKENFLQRVEEIAASKPKGMILREKDLSEKEYKELAEKVLVICKTYDVPCMLHSFIDVAMELGAENIHLPLHILRKVDEKTKETFKIIGASCHSVEEAIEAERLGCTYITAGHVFVTDCKKGLARRGLEFLREVCESVSVPVYAIGGISSENIELVRKTGAAGACVMSGLMICENVKETMKGFEIKV